MTKITKEDIEIAVTKVLSLSERIDERRSSNFRVIKCDDVRQSGKDLYCMSMLHKMISESPTSIFLYVYPRNSMLAVMSKYARTLAPNVFVCSAENLVTFLYSGNYWSGIVMSEYTMMDSTLVDKAISYAKNNGGTVILNGTPRYLEEEAYEKYNTPV